MGEFGKMVFDSKLSIGQKYYLRLVLTVICANLKLLRAFKTTTLAVNIRLSLKILADLKSGGLNQT